MVKIVLFEVPDGEYVLEHGIMIAGHASDVSSYRCWLFYSQQQGLELLTQMDDDAKAREEYAQEIRQSTLPEVHEWQLRLVAAGAPAVMLQEALLEYGSLSLDPTPEGECVYGLEAQGGFPPYACCCWWKEMGEDVIPAMAIIYSMEQYHREVVPAFPEEMRSEYERDLTDLKLPKTSKIPVSILVGDIVWHIWCGLESLRLTQMRDQAVRTATHQAVIDEGIHPGALVHGFGAPFKA